MSVVPVTVSTVTDTVLQALRARVLDEDEPLAGLLRKCLILGAETGSSALREWARRELNGYVDDGAVPDYRTIDGAVILFDGLSGNTWTSGRSIHPLQLPASAREHLPDTMTLRQPVEELERLSLEDSINFRTGPLSLAEMLWNRDLGAYQQVLNLRYALAGSTLTGIVGQVRTNLVEIVVDLTAGTPLTDLPPTARVNEVMRERIGQVGDTYNTNIHQPTGPAAVGKGATARAEGLTLVDVMALLAEMQRTIATVPSSPERDEAEHALTRLSELVEQDEPETGEIIRSAGRVRSAINRLGNAGATAAATRAAEALTEMAMNGQFL